MANVQGESIYLSHTGQDIDDCIDDVVNARGDYASLSAALAAKADASRLGGLSFMKLTKAQYDALEEKDENTIYFIEGRSSIGIAAGDKPAETGGGGVAVSGAVVPTLFGVTRGVIGIPQSALHNRAYIQASGAQGINTGFTPTTTDVEYKVEFADFEMPESGWAEIYGGYYYGVKAQPGAWSVNPDKNSGKMVLCIGSNDLFASVDVPRSGYHELTTTISNGSVSVNIDGNVTISDTWSGRLDCPVGLCCGVARENDSTRIFEMGTLKVYRFRIYESGSLVRDFVPALGANDRPAFYDNVTQTYFYSETGTDFVYVPAETEE